MAKKVTKKNKVEEKKVSKKKEVVKEETRGKNVINVIQDAFDESSRKTYRPGELGDYKTFLLGDPWSEEFLSALELSPHYDLVRKWISEELFSKENTSYYKMLMNEVENKSFWGKMLVNKEGVEKQFNKFYSLFLSIKERGQIAQINNHSVYNKETKHTHFFGEISLFVDNDGQLHFEDGMHRAAILFALGRPIKFLVVKREDLWNGLYNELEETTGKGLYQSIMHPDFSDWITYRDNMKEQVLKDFVKKYNVTTVYDLGCCFGETLCELRGKLSWAVGVETDSLRAQVADKVLSKCKFSFSKENMLDFLNKTQWNICAIFALSSLHHFMRTEPIEKFDSLLKRISELTYNFVYEVPDKSETEFYEWIYPEIRENIHDYIKSKLYYFGKIEEEVYKVHKRDIHILRRMI